MSECKYPNDKSLHGKGQMTTELICIEGWVASVQDKYLMGTTHLMKGRNSDQETQRSSWPDEKFHNINSVKIRRLTLVDYMNLWVHIFGGS